MLIKLQWLRGILLFFTSFFTSGRRAVGSLLQQPSLILSYLSLWYPLPLLGTSFLVVSVGKNKIQGLREISKFHLQSSQQYAPLWYPLPTKPYGRRQMNICVCLLSLLSGCSTCLEIKRAGWRELPLYTARFRFPNLLQHEEEEIKKGREKK